MRLMRIVAAAAILFAVTPAFAADEVIEAIDQARKAYQGGDLAAAKQSLDLASQLIGQKNADAFGKLLPAPLAGWKAEEVQTTSIGNVGFGASTASRTYTNAKGDTVEVQITGDSAMVMQIAAVLSNPQFAGAMGKLIRIGQQRAIQNSDGDVNMVVNNKFLITIQGSADAASKVAY